MNRFILMIQFFTRLPVNKTVPVELEDFKYGSIYMPVIGLIVGLISAAAYILIHYTGNIYFAGVAAILAGALVTGALHMDGLADTCDGIFSSRSKDRMLEIMKDSRIGTMGALALVFLVLAKVSLVWGLNYTAAISSLIVVPVLSRTGMLYGISIARYPREKGLGKSFIGSVTIRQFMVGLVLCLIIIFPVLRLYSAVFVIMVFGIPYVFNKYMEKKIGGMTGDTLGALCEIQEVLYLILLNVLSNFIWR